MTLYQIKKIITKSLKDLENESLIEGVDLLSEEYKSARERLRQNILEKFGISMDEYKEYDQMLKDKSKVKSQKAKDEISQQLKELEDRILSELNSKIASIGQKTLSWDEITKKPEVLSKSQISLLITNAISNIPKPEVKKPVIQVNRNITERITQKVEYDDEWLRKELAKINDRVTATPDLKEELGKIKNSLADDINKSINVFNMPDFRKLAMGLQAQIDEIRNETPPATTPGGLDTQVQFNDGGSFGGDAGLTYDKTTDTLSGNIFRLIDINGYFGSYVRVLIDSTELAKFTLNGTASSLTLTSVSLLNFVDGGVPVSITATQGSSLTLSTDGGNIFIGNGASSIVDIKAYTSVTFETPHLDFVSSVSGKDATLFGDNLTADRNYQFPNASGTFALTSDLSSYVPYTGATGAVTLGANTLSTTSGLITPKIYPSANSTTAIQILKADGTTNILNVDTTNSRIGIGTATPADWLEVKGAGAGIIINDTGTVPQLRLQEGGTTTGSFATSSTNLTINANRSGATMTLKAANTTIAVLAVPTGSSSTSNFLNVTGTLPTTITQQTNGVYFAITSAGSSNQVNRAFIVQMLAGYTGVNTCTALEFNNNAASTGNNLKLDTSTFGPLGNVGIDGFTYGTTTGLNIGGYFESANGGVGVGVVGKAITAKNGATNIGVLGVGLNTGSTPIHIGGYFGLQAATPTFASAALMCDNGSTTSDIFVARDNGTAQFTIADGGLLSLYKGITTAGWGVPAIYGSYSTTGNTGAVTNAINYTPPATAGRYRIRGVVNVTAWTTPASFTVVVTYKDDSGTTQTETLALTRGTTGATATAITAIDRWYFYLPLFAINNGATAITVSTTGTFTGSPVYNLSATLEQLA